MYTVDSGVAKVREVADNHSMTTVVLPPLPSVTPEAMARVNYIENKLKEIEGGNLRVIDLGAIEYDASEHPSLDGTRAIIRKLESEIGEEIVLPEATNEDMVTSHKYNQVQSLYKAGCRGCDSPDFTQSLCCDCWGKAEGVSVEVYEALVESYRIQLFPDTLASPLNVSTATLVGDGEGKGEEVMEVEESNVILGTVDVNVKEDVVMGDGKVFRERNGDSSDESPLAKRAK